MRPLIGSTSIVFGALVVGLLVHQAKSGWLVFGVFRSEFMVFGAVITMIVLFAAALGMMVGGAALLFGRQWSLRFTNRYATALVLAILSYFSLVVFANIPAVGEYAVADELLVQWGRGFAVSLVPIVVVWWTGRHAKTPVSELSWTRRQNEKRGRHMSGQCRQCHAALNFATHDGLESLPDEPFKLRCSQCHNDLTLHDVA